MRPRTFIPELQYSHLLPGGNFKGNCEYAIASSARVQFARGAGTSLRPDVCVSKSRNMIVRGAFLRVMVSPLLLSINHWFLNSGRYFSTGSSTDSLPSS